MSKGKQMEVARLIFRGGAETLVKAEDINGVINEVANAISGEHTYIVFDGSLICLDDIVYFGVAE